MIPVRFIACLGVFAAGALPLRAEVTATIAQGYLTSTIAAGTGTGAATTVLSFPLQHTATAAGQMVAPLTSVTANTITNDNAGWTPGELSQEAAPYVLRLTSGNAAGRTFLLSSVTPNTQTTVAIHPTEALGTDLTTLGIVSGDTYQIVPANTLAGVLGTPVSTGILGGTMGPNGCDQVQLLQTSGWISYYYDTASNHWRRASSPNVVADNVVVRPDTGVIYNRYGTSPLSITLLGAVPSVARQAEVFRSGPTALSNNWPVALTLGTSSIQTTPGWTDGATVNTADTVQVYSLADGWRQYFYDGTHWRLGAEPTTISDDVVLPVGTVVIINKIGSATGQVSLSQALPYSLVPAQ